ncbi:MAG: efflux RND transporter periplasmic adaptor subunit [Planctomycetota bacterium]
MKPWLIILKQRLAPLAVIGAVVVGVVAFAIVAQTDTPDHTDGPGAEPLVVNWQPVETAPGYTVTRAFVGRVEARQESDLGFEIPGLVTEVAVDEGDRVAAGQLLAKLDTRLLEARREELRAARDQAQAQLDLADIRLRRIDRAHKKRAATDDELDEAQQTRLAAAADLARTTAAVTSLEVEIEKSVLTAPYDAVVAMKHVDAGRVVSAGTAVLELFEIDRPEVRLGVGGTLIDQLAVGQTHDVSVAGRTVTGTVRTILPSRGRVGRDVDVMLELDITLDKLRRGDLARVELQRTIDEPGVWLPVQSLTEGVRGLWSVYTIETSTDATHGKLRRVDVEILHPETDRIYVRSVLPEGTKVAVGGLHRVAPGMAVRLAAPGSQPTPDSGSSNPHGADTP